MTFFDVFGILFFSICTLYVCYFIVLGGYLLATIHFNRRRSRAFYILLSYNLWVKAVLHKPALEIYIPENILPLAVSPIRTLFCPIWHFYPDVDVRNSLRRYYHSSDFIPKSKYNEVLKEYLLNGQEDFE